MLLLGVCASITAYCVGHASGLATKYDPAQLALAKQWKEMSGISQAAAIDWQLLSAKERANFICWKETVPAKIRRLPKYIDLRGTTFAIQPVNADDHFAMPKVKKCVNTLRNMNAKLSDPKDARIIIRPYVRGDLIFGVSETGVEITDYRGNSLATGHDSGEDSAIEAASNYITSM